MGTRAKPWYGFLPWAKTPRFDLGVFTDDLKRIRTFYQDQGYHEVTLDSSLTRISNRVRVLIQIEEGPLTLVQHAEVVGLHDVLQSVQKTILQKGNELIGQPLVRQEVIKQTDFMVRQLKDHGYAFAKTSVDFQIEHAKAHIVFTVLPGPVCRIDSIQVVGNEKIATPTVLRGVTFHNGDLFSDTKLRDSQRQLYRAGVFRSVALGIPDSVEAVTPVTVVLRVAERPFRSLKFGGGYDTDEAFRIFAEWAHRNFWGDARQVKLSGKWSGRGREAVVGLRQPYFFGSRNWLTIGGSLLRNRRANFEQDEISGNATLERNLGQNSHLVFQLSGGLIDFKADSAFTDYRTTFLIDTRDDVFDPTLGVLAQLAVRQRGRLFQSDAEFIQLTAEGRWFLPLPFDSVLGLRSQAGVIFEIGSPGQVPSIERFFAGGMNSVRGWALDDLGPRVYSENARDYIPVGGLSKWVGGAELRTRWGAYWGTAFFLDVGKVGNNAGDLLPTDLGWAAGGGVRFFTPVGPLRIDVGYRLSEDDLRVLNRWHYFISLGQAF